MKTITKFLLRFVSERYLLRRGLWDECSGDPMNLEAEEFDRRDAAIAAEQVEAQPLPGDKP